MTTSLFNNGGILVLNSDFKVPPLRSLFFLTHFMRPTGCCRFAPTGAS